MSTSRGAEALPLSGADCFLRAFDAETRRANGSSHLSQLVLRLGAGFDLEAFRDVLARVVEVNPILRAPIGRRLGVGAPVYRLDRAARAAPPRLEVHDAAEPAGQRRAELSGHQRAELSGHRRAELAGHGQGERLAGPSQGLPPLPALFARRLNEVRSARRGELLRIDVVRHGGGALGTDLAFTWLHLLLDGAGSERFVAFLEAVRSGARAPDAVPEADRPGGPDDVALPTSLRERGAMATGWHRRMKELGALGVCSPAGPRRRVRQELEYELRVFSEEASARIRERAARCAGFLTPMLFYLAAAIRAHHAVQHKRAVQPESYVVPLPVNLRPKGGEGGLFRTRVSMIWFQVPAARADDLDALLDELKEQRRRAIRERQIEGGVAAMDFARFAPARLYASMARRPLGGELCSFFFAYTDEFCAGLEHFFGAPIEDGFHAPSVPASPGSGLVFSLRAGRLHCVHVRQRHVIDASELDCFREQLERDLVGTG